MFIRYIKSKYTFLVVIYYFQQIPDVAAAIAEVCGVFYLLFRKRIDFSM